LLPDDGPDLIDRASGRFQLRRILLPICGDRDVSAATSLIGTLLHKLAGGGLSVTLLQVGTTDRHTKHRLPSNPDIEWHQVERPGKLADVILTEAERIDADLIVMTTARRTRWIDRFRNARVEQVLRRVRRPLLTVASE
jgi:nucleotide-binding universal stress UspA family protein